MNVHKQLLHLRVGPRDHETVGHFLCATAEVAVKAVTRCGDERNRGKNLEADKYLPKYEVFHLQTENTYSTVLQYVPFHLAPATPVTALERVHCRPKVQQTPVLVQRGKAVDSCLELWLADVTNLWTSVSVIPTGCTNTAVGWIVKRRQTNKLENYNKGVSFICGRSRVNTWCLQDHGKADYVTYQMAPTSLHAWALKGRNIYIYTTSVMWSYSVHSKHMPLVSAQS